MIYKDASRPIEERVEDLMSRMSFEQKIDQITCLVTISEDIPDFKEYVPQGIGHVGAFTVADSVEPIMEYVYRLQKFLTEETELGIPALIHCEASAGGQFTGATVFPSAIGQASTFDDTLVREMGDVIRQQMFAVGFRQALSPVLDISRDPRWGRVTETYGEDPALASAIGCSFIAGLQSDDLSQGVAATAKHFVGHGVTDGGLNMGGNPIPERSLLETHCKPFQAAITECGLPGVMTSYCSLNGEPVSGSHKLLTTILRGELGFEGIAVSDYIAVDRLVDPFHVADTFTEAGVRALKAGLDVEYPRPKGYTYELKREIEEGRLTMEAVDAAVKRVLTLKFRLGLFENPYPDRELFRASVEAPEVKLINEKLARESVILLKNQNHTLPLKREKGLRIAVVGPHADSVRSYFGTFSYPAVIDMTMTREEDGQIFEEPGLIVYDIEQSCPGRVRDCSPRIEKRIRREFPDTKSLYQSVKEYLPDAQVRCARGINCAGSDLGEMETALDCAAEADLVLLTLGGKNGWGVTSTVGEGVDSTNIGLPGRQEEFARKIYALGKKTVVLHFDGRPLSNEYVASHFDAILEVWQPGEQGGKALCELLFGAYSPSGRLPVTAARNVGQLPVYYSLPRGSGYVGAGHTGMIRNPNGYINDTAFPLYYFGHGLSYTEFTYSNLQIKNTEIGSEDEIAFTVDVENTGEYDGDEVVQFYLSDETASMVRPERELAGFCRVPLRKGERKTIRFCMKASQASFLDENMKWVVEKGKYCVLVGASSQDIRLTGEFYVRETKETDQRTRGFYTEGEIIP
ncbi:MAG: glycoside hydrolase family 3 C-terminal domain-containing protein [Lachnospiraceae bacterium]|nr:glycoside hydrolase family 3 C-terminal domain-containing protein [Lachnospiraceae bacterium]